MLMPRRSSSSPAPLRAGRAFPGIRSSLSRANPDEIVLGSRLVPTASTSVDSPPDLRPPRIALLVDAIHPRARASQQPASLVVALAQLGAVAEVVPIHAGVLARVPREGPLWREEERLREAHLETAAEEGPEGQDAGEPPDAEAVLGGLLRFCPDALVAYDASSPAAWIGARASARLGRPLLLIEPAWTSMRSLRDRLLEGLGRRLWGRLVRAQARHVFATDPLAEKLALEKGFKPGQIEVLPVGVDTEIYRAGRPTAWLTRFALRGRILLYVGPLEPGRGIEMLIRAFARSVGQREDWCLVLAGSGSLNHRCVVQASRLGISDRVHTVPYPNASELPGLLGASTLLAVPALDERTRGAQIPRALACGLPVIAADLERLSCQLVHGEHGLLVSAGDENAWRDALTRAASSPELRRRWSAAGREKALTRDWRSVASKVLETAQREMRSPVEPDSTGEDEWSGPGGPEAVERSA